MSFDIFPSQASFDSIDVVHRYSERSCNVAVALSCCNSQLDFLHKANRQNRFLVVNPLRHSPFASRILLVIGNCADKEMVRIHTARVIALVANKQPIRNRFNEELIRVPVRSKVFVPDGEYTVTEHSFWAGPFPASTVSNNNVGEEPSLHSVVGSAVPTSTRTETLLRGWESVKRLSAFWASAFDVARIGLRHFGSSLTGLGVRRAPGCFRTAGVSACPILPNGEAI